jgi:hypothetical protein
MEHGTVERPGNDGTASFSFDVVRFDRDPVRIRERFFGFLRRHLVPRDVLDIGVVPLEHAAARISSYRD